MVTEFAEIEILAGREDDFRDGVARSKPVFARADGCHGLELHRSIENPTHFVLLIKWENVAAHQAFRSSADFAVWRGAVAHCFDGAPKVWHSETVV